MGGGVAWHYPSKLWVNLDTSLRAAFTDGYSTYAGGKAPLEHFTRAAAGGATRVIPLIPGAISR